MHIAQVHACQNSLGGAKIPKRLAGLLKVKDSSVLGKRGRQIRLDCKEFEVHGPSWIYCQAHPKTERASKPG